MKVDKKSQESLSKILNIAFRTNKGIKIYEEVASQGLNHIGNKSMESSQNIRKIKNFSPFQKFISSPITVKDSQLNSVHKEVMSKLREKKQVYLSKKDSKKFFSQPFVVEKIKNMVQSSLDFSVPDLSQRQLLKISSDVKRARDAELVKGFLLTKNENTIGSYFHLISKGIKNIENPSANKLIPKELIQQTGMIQIGLALNELALLDKGSKIADLTEKETLLIKMKSQRGQHATEFINKCKDTAKLWKTKHSMTLDSLIEKQRVRDEINKTVSTNESANEEDVHLKKAAKKSYKI